MYVLVLGQSLLTQIKQTHNFSTLALFLNVPVQVRTSQICLKDVEVTAAIWFISGPEVQSLQFVSSDLRTSKTCSRGATGPS